VTIAVRAAAAAISTQLSAINSEITYQCPS
jgi:hypothetical protein